jgi:osmotically-inducible protein OsmY
MRQALPVLAALTLVLGGCGNSSTDQPPEPFGSRAPGTVLKDGLILAAVKAKLTADDPNSVATLGVGVESGVVTLRGTVHTAADRTRLAADARGVRGVARVDDDLIVNPHATKLEGSVADFALAARVETALQVAAGFQQVTAHADHGIVTLTGTVKDEGTRARVVGAARQTSGVRNVVDQLRVGGT